MMLLIKKMNFGKRFKYPLVYSDYEYRLAKECIIPELKQLGIDISEKKLLDAGCGFGGCSVAFAEEKAKCSAFDSSTHQIYIARKFARQRKVKVKFFIDDICNLREKGKFDIIVFREVIEYVRSPYRALFFLNRALKPNGFLYITFQPWYGPYGGHQHHPDSITRFIPFFHLLPKFIVFNALKNKRGLMKKGSSYVDEIKHIIKNKISIAKFDNLVRISGLRIHKKNIYLLRPAFKIRYGLPIIRSDIVPHIPIINEFITSGAEYILRK